MPRLSEPRKPPLATTSKRKRVALAPTKSKKHKSPTATPRRSGRLRAKEKEENAPVTETNDSDGVGGVDVVDEGTFELQRSDWGSPIPTRPQSRSGGEATSCPPFTDNDNEEETENDDNDDDDDDDKATGELIINAAPLRRTESQRPALKRGGSCLREAAVEEQTLAMSNSDTIWNACATGDLKRLKAMVTQNPELVWERGFVGETPIHLCSLLRKHELAYWLIENDSSVALARYKGEPYDGENCLHIAIVNRDHEMALRLARAAPALLRQPATGHFFQDRTPLTPGGVDTPCYYGEYALHFAASTNQPELFDALLALEPDMIDLCDGIGNTLLHLCVIHEWTNMYDHVCDAWTNSPKGKYFGGDDKQLWNMHNSADQTPLVLAAHRGSRVMFEHVLERSKKVQWSYGPVTCLIYPLAEFDLIPGAPIGALEAIVTNEHYPLLEVPRVVDLLRKKWETFGKRIFFTKFLFTLFFMSLFSCCTVCRTLDVHYANTLRSHMQNGEVSAVFASAQTCLVQAAWNWNWDAVMTCWLFLGDLLVFLGSAFKLRRELDELRQEGIKGYFWCSGAAFVENVCSMTFCWGILLTALFRLGVPLPGDETAVLAIISVVGWMYMLFFLLGHPSTGPVVVMMQKMFVQDVLLFIVIYSVFLLGFAQAFYVELGEHGWGAFGNRIKRCFSTMLGDIDFDEFTSAHHPLLSTFLITIYVALISVMLLNLLIAMMGDTYAKIQDDARMIWQLERARILFSIETEMSTDERIRNLAGYQIEIGGAKYVQVYKVDEDHFKCDWCDCGKRLDRCTTCGQNSQMELIARVLKEAETRGIAE